ncbi:hypothetical protein IE53DRAFT_387335 [Violaceomyces palustris]|uniref:Uncharacterized protein n=1 Tax=Violaceomyces palustris TaxID=1673888 RepID=A0ACD0NX00_9BASI|nr:hypothetical protein IE53DRAFT_387335 [Violaceomyces palustris]
MPTKPKPKLPPSPSSPYLIRIRSNSPSSTLIKSLLISILALLLVSLLALHSGPPPKPTDPSLHPPSTTTDQLRGIVSWSSHPHQKDDRPLPPTTCCPSPQRRWSIRPSIDCVLCPRQDSSRSEKPLLLDDLLLLQCPPPRDCYPVWSKRCDDCLRLSSSSEQGHQRTEYGALLWETWRRLHRNQTGVYEVEESAEDERSRGLLPRFALPFLHHQYRHRAKKDGRQSNWMKRSETPTSDNVRASLDGRGIFSIVVFAIVSLIVIFPIRIPLPGLLSSKLEESSRRLKIWLDLCLPAAEEGRALHSRIQRGEGRDQGALIKDSERYHLVINHVTAPILGVILLLITKTIGFQQVKVGIVGEEGVEPYDVLALFISLAYIAISLDSTGLLRYLALQVCQKAGERGLTTYLLLYLFFWTAGVLVGNDPVILSGTAFLVYFTRVAGISPPDAWIWAQFVAANISSAVLVSSNPTNLVIASGFDIPFPKYTAFMVLPSFVSALAALAALLLHFRNRKGGEGVDSGLMATRGRRVQSLGKSLLSVVGSVARIGPSKAKDGARGEVELQGMRKRKPNTNTEANTEDQDHQDASAPRRSDRMDDQTGSERKEELTEEVEEEEDASESERHHAQPPLIYIPRTIIRPDVNARAALVDPYGAVFGTLVMGATLATLVATSVVGGVKVFEIAVPGACLCLLRDAGYDLLRWRRGELEKRRRRISEQDGQDEAGIGPASPRSDRGGREGERIEMEETSAGRSGGGSSGTVQPNPVGEVKEEEGSKKMKDCDVPAVDPAADSRGRRSNGGEEEGARGKEEEEGKKKRKEEGMKEKKGGLALLLIYRILRTPNRTSEMLPTVTSVMARLPFPLLPFAFGMFILVQALAHVGFINILASGLADVCSKGSVATAFFISFLSVILCNIGGTNIGSTILLTKAIQSPYFQSSLSRAVSTGEKELIIKTATYSIAFGSNVGALGGTFAASLAGLLWLSGLRQGGIQVRARDFLTWCLVVILPATVAGVGVLLIEVRWFPI